MSVIKRLKLCSADCHYNFAFTGSDSLDFERKSRPLVFTDNFSVAAELLELSYRVLKKCSVAGNRKLPWQSKTMLIAALDSLVPVICISHSHPSDENPPSVRSFK